MENQKGWVGIVTGGSRGIGAAIAREMASQGVDIVINYQNRAQTAQALADELRNEYGVESLAIQGDVSSPEDARQLVHTVTEKFGRLDILVNNAGITRDRSFKKLSADDWNQVIDVNLNSVYYMTHASLPHLLESQQGRIINISSIIGQAGGFGQTNYAAAKAGLVGFTKSLALELAKTAVTVNCICPGFIETDMLAYVPEEVREQIKGRIPQRRFGRPEEIARTVTFLVQDGGYMTGQSLNVNGGLYM